MSSSNVARIMALALFGIFAVATFVYSQNLAIPPLAPDEPAPEFSLSSMTGETHTLAQHRGEIVFINFWTTWCEACKEETPDLNRFHKEHGDEVVMLGINMEEPTVSIEKFIDEFKVKYMVLRDPRGHTADEYGLRGVPESYFVDGDGILRVKVIGPMTFDEMEEAVRTTREKTGTPVREKNK